MKVLITGAGGFIGQNLVEQLKVRNGVEVMPFGRSSSSEELRQGIRAADFVCHLAGVNRPENAKEFAEVNAGLTRQLCKELLAADRRLPVIFASSVHVERDNEYGRSKLAAEQALLAYSKESAAPVHIFRLPHVIGKWCRPNYNSVVATFCYNIARGLPIRLDDPSFLLKLVYIDDLVDNFFAIMKGQSSAGPFHEAIPSYPITVGDLAEQIKSFRACRESLVVERVGSGLNRALYATYISYLPQKDFAYPVPKYGDPRGVFVEMLKTKDSGQFSYFTAHPGITRGEHYHHSKTEKFLVIKGTARFRFRHLLTNETYEVITSGEKPEIVETIPGYAHNITNVGSDEMVVMLWANEIFDRERPDTYACKV
jgi:UDP-2-acetamido-2,6-beta-L-arabino-hexul-4-ose reductase